MPFYIEIEISPDAPQSFVSLEFTDSLGNSYIQESALAIIRNCKEVEDLRHQQQLRERVRANYFANFHHTVTDLILERESIHFDQTKTERYKGIFIGIAIALTVFILLKMAR